MSCLGLGFFNQRILPCGIFWVHVKRETVEEPLGIKTLSSEGLDGLVITDVNLRGTLIGKWNNRNEGDRVKPCQAILSVNGHTDSQNMMDELRWARSLKMEISLTLRAGQRELLRQEKKAEKLPHRMAQVEAMLPEVQTTEGLNETCSVCLDGLLSLAAPGKVVQLPCGHCFHRGCISKWLACGTSPTCPLCKMQLEIPCSHEDCQGPQGSQVHVMNF
eukprot:s1502_g11.t1